MKGILCSAEEDPALMIDRVDLIPHSRTDQVAQVSTKTAYASPGRGFRVVLMDFGMKHGILRELNKRNCDVIVVPHDTSSEEIRTTAARWHHVIEWTWRSEGCTGSHPNDQRTCLEKFLSSAFASVISYLPSPAVGIHSR